jgi:hypothetical protein
MSKFLAGVTSSTATTHEVAGLLQLGEEHETKSNLKLNLASNIFSFQHKLKLKLNMSTSRDVCARANREISWT